MVIVAHFCLIRVRVMVESNENKDILEGKVVVLGVSGSIAAYKAADLTRELRKAGAEVFVL